MSWALIALIGREPIDGYPIVPLVVRQTREESPGLPIRKTFFDDRLANLQGCHAREFQPGSKVAKIMQAPVQTWRQFLMCPRLNPLIHPVQLSGRFRNPIA